MSRARTISRHRTGSAYLIALGTTVIVSLLALAGMTLVRLERRQFDGLDHLAQAQANATAAMEMALLQVEDNPTWREQMKGGTWAADRRLGAGWWSFIAQDPVDGDLTNSIYDNVLLTATGKDGPAQHRLRAMLKVEMPGYRCLEAAVHSQAKLKLDGSAVHSNGVLSANDDLDASNGAQIYADAESATAVKGATYYGQATTLGDWPRTMPDKNTVFDYYVANGTAISYSSLPLWDRNLLSNPGAEATFAGEWVARGTCLVLRDGLVKHSGSKSVSAAARTAAWNGPAQIVTNQIESGQTYAAKAWARWGLGTDDMRIGLELTSSGDGVQTVYFTPWTPVGTAWEELKGNAQITWNGELTKALWFVEARTNVLGTLYIDDTELRDANAVANCRVIHRAALGPDCNPFGATTNPEGIYVIDCAGGQFNIRNSRIKGTLVFLNQHGGSTHIQGSVFWTSAATNFPAILTNKELRLTIGRAALDESQANANFNPAQMPYMDADADKTDSYPAVIEGIIYSADKIRFGGQPQLKGSVIANSDLEITAATFDIDYSDTFLQRAPPGFRRGPELHIAPGSFQVLAD